MFSVLHKLPLVKWINLSIFFSIIQFFITVDPILDVLMM